MRFVGQKVKFPWLLRVASGVFVAAALGGAVVARLSAGKSAEAKVLGLDKVIAFTYTPKGFDPKQLHSVTLVGPTKAEDSQYWRARGVVTGVLHGWTDLLRSPVEKAADILVNQNYGGDPHPVVMIDEFGFDFGGGMDEKSARILRQVKQQKPDLALTVFEMRGPIAPVLADAYRDVADLVMMESYVSDKSQYWWIASQVWAARRYGILPKTIVILGVGKGGEGENWAQTKEELEQQIRFVRLIAPESPGVGFFGGTAELLADADALCAHFSDFPTDGSGLPEDVRSLASTFSGKHEKATLVVSPDFVEPNYNEDGSGKLVQPKTLRPYLINLGDQDASNVKVRLRNPPDKGGNVFAEGVVPLIPKRSAAVGILSVTADWHVWVGEWEIEVEAPSCVVLPFRRKK